MSEGASLVEARPSSLRVWMAAIRPATLTAALAPVGVGSALAAADGVFRPLVAAAALLGAMLIQIGTNLHNDYADFEKGADTEERLGQARATQRGWLTPMQVALAAALVALLAMAVGVYLVSIGGWPIVVIGLCSLLCGWAYTGGPFPLGYVGLGDVFVLVFFGGVAVCGTYYVQALTWSTSALWASIPVGALATAILVINNLRDRHTDAEAGKRTLVVRFGERFGRAEYLVMLVVAYLIPPLAWALGFGQAGWMLSWLSAPVAWMELRTLSRSDGAALNPLLGRTARLGLLYGILFSIGALL
jgi:1,4-dihydroxy-2-naphthoate octaprenyltransferase